MDLSDLEEDCRGLSNQLEDGKDLFDPKGDVMAPYILEVDDRLLLVLYLCLMDGRCLVDHASEGHH